LYFGNTRESATADRSSSLANVTLRFAVILILLGGIFFYLTGSHAPTSLIPVIFGVVLFVVGLLARSESESRRKLFMHIAVTVGLLGFLFPAIRSGMALFARYVKGVPIAHLRAVQEELLMAVICLVYVILCVQSFIAVRRSRAQ